MTKHELTEGQIKRLDTEREIAKLKLTQPFPTAEGIRAHQRQIEDLEASLRGLPPVPRDLPDSFYRVIAQ